MSPTRAPSAKQFLIDRIVSQAKLENIHLTEIEIRMLGFAEASADANDMEAARAFERDFDDEEYEAKVAGLIRHAYERDKTAGEVETWDNALARIASRDIYLNVMIDHARIGNTGPAALFSDWRFVVYGLLPPGLFLVGAAIIGLSPFGRRLIPNDALRLLIAALFIALPFAIQWMSRSKLLNRQKRRRNSHSD